MKSPSYPFPGGKERAIFTTRIDQPDWSVVAVCRRSGASPFEPAAGTDGRVKGPLVATYYNTANSPALPNSPSQLNNRGDREWLILRLLEPATEWIKHVRSDPIYLVLP
jgi:hypothetical protein